MQIRFSKETIDRLELPADRPQLVAWDTKTRGLGLVVGRTRRTFVCDGRVDGKRRRVVLGHYPDMNVARARAAAAKALGEMEVDGVDRNEQARARRNGPTLRDAVSAHVERARKRRRSEVHLAQMVRECEKHLAAWMDRPIAELNGTELSDLHTRIKESTERRGKGPNAPGAVLANRIIIYVGAAWNSLNKKLLGQLGTWNPAKAVDREVIRPNRTRIADSDLPRWRADLDAMRDPVRRDGLLFALFTGLRDEDVRTVRWENVDLEERSLRLPDPKGGEAKAFTLPLSDACVEILERRQADNPALFEAAGGDAGWAFPGWNKDGEVVAIPDLRETRRDQEGRRFRFPQDDVHTLRRTYLSIAAEIGISELDQHALSNHSFGSHNVNATYIAQQFDHLFACQERISAAITERLAGKRPAPSRGRRKLRAV